MAMITVRQLMEMCADNQPWSVSPQDTVYRALERMAEKNVGALLVVENGLMVGIFTERDYARKIILMGRASLDTPVEEIMTKDMVTIDSEQTIEECLELMTKHRIRHLPVMEHGRLVGMVSMRDVIDVIISRKQDTIDNLENFIMGQGYGR
jgi:CBS domain-containing protein